MYSQVSFAQYIKPEELAELALKMANTFSPMGHEQPLAEVVYGWLKENRLNARLQPILTDRANVGAVLAGSGGPPTWWRSWRVPAAARACCSTRISIPK